ncbi:MAG: MutS-related protein, partial [Pleomorphochaeta sp.]
MALRDNIEIGESYFMAEIRSLRRIMDECKKQRCVCFIDEILRGTNTPERIAASTAVLRVLHKTKSMCLVASHDIELTEILDEIYDNYHFSEHFEKEEVVFDYLLKKGPSKSRNAIRLLEYMGFDEQVVIDARAMLCEK